MIMGNKSDCHLGRVVMLDEGQMLALVSRLCMPASGLVVYICHLVPNSLPQELSALFSETSASSGDNVLQSQATLASLLLERQNSEIYRIRSSMLQLDNTDENKKCAY